MSTATTTRTKYVSFATDKNGRKIAYQFFQGRYFRIKLAEAELWVMTGEAIEEPYIKF